MNSLEVHEIGNKLSIIMLSASLSSLAITHHMYWLWHFAEACYFCTIRSWQEYYHKLMVNYKLNKSDVRCFYRFLQGAKFASSIFLFTNNEQDQYTTAKKMLFDCLTK